MRKVTGAGLLSLAVLPGVCAAQGSCPTILVEATPEFIPHHGTITLSLTVETGVRMTTNQGVIDIELMLDTAPVTSANFLRYAQYLQYNGTVFHRSVPLSVQSQIGVIQGGGFTAPTQAVTQMPTAEQPLTNQQRPRPVATFAPIALEHPVGNVRGTVAMARTNNPNSATSQFFINTVDNNVDVGGPNPRFSLDAVAGSPGREGYAVFGTVKPASMSVVDSIAARAVMDISYILDDFSFGEAPLRRPHEDEVTFPLLPSDYVVVSSVVPTTVPVASWPMGAGLTYQWWTGNEPIIDGGRFNGATTPALSISDASMADYGSYKCVVSGLACGPVQVYRDITCAADLAVGGGQPGSDGLLNNNDVIMFIEYFFTHDPRADMGSVGGTPGADGVWNNNDFVVYIDLFFSGC